MSCHHAFAFFACQVVCRDLPDGFAGDCMQEAVIDRQPDAGFQEVVSPQAAVSITLIKKCEMALKIRCAVPLSRCLKAL